MVKKQTIAIDIRKILRPKTGIGKYIEQLVRHLAEIEAEFEYLLLGDRPINSEEIPDGCRYVHLGRFYRETGKVAQIYSPFWLNLFVPKFLTLENVALFHGPNFVIPIKTDCPCITTIHDLAFLKVPGAYTKIYRNYIKFQVKNSVSRAAAIIANSQTTKRDLISLMQVPKEKIYVIYHGIESKFYSQKDRDFLEGVREKFRLPQRFLLNVGVIERRKNIETLLEAAAPLIRDRLTEGVVLAGKDGLGAEEIRKFAAKIGVVEHLRFLGYVPDDQLVGLYNLAQCFVFPSWYEGFGMPILEAMACGCPVVASESSSISEVAGEAALFFPPGSAQVLEVKLRQVLTSKRLRDEMVKKGYSWVGRFTWQQCAQEHLRVYRKVLLDFGRKGA